LVDIGVYKGMLERWGPDFHKKTIIAGASAGVVLAVAVKLQISPERIAELYLESGKRARFGIFQNGDSALEHHCLRKLICTPDVPVKLAKQCFIGVTGFFSQHFWVSEWEDNEDLINCLKASLHVPLLTSPARPVRNLHVVDGRASLLRFSPLSVH
jgi:hypothetical protein